MTKRFCDLCGKEIHNLQETYRVSVERNASIYVSDPSVLDVIVDVKEICPACAKRIHQTVQELKQEGGQWLRNGRRSALLPRSRPASP